MTTPSTPKTCFVTVGATASFTALVTRVITPSFLSALQAHGYSELLVQYGEKGQGLFDAAVRETAAAQKSSGIKVSGFGIDKAGLGKYMRQAKAIGASHFGAAEGVVISHAGSGTILDALRLSVPLIVVPNPTLLDNHQLELAEALAEQEYVVHGALDNLPQAISDAEKLRQRQHEWPPVNSGMHGQIIEARGLKGILDEEMGFLD